MELFSIRIQRTFQLVSTVECLVKQVLLRLAIDTVLFRNLVLVSHLYAQNALKQVGSVAGLGCCCCLHISWF